MNHSGNFGNESTGTLIALTRTNAGRKASTISAWDRQPKSKHASGCVAKQRDHRAWFARTTIEPPALNVKKKQEFA
jgi:hypothetical protein